MIKTTKIIKMATKMIKIAKKVQTDAAIQVIRKIKKNMEIKTKNN